MAARPNSSGPESSAGSQAELPPVHGLNKMGVLPEEWTLPHEWKIEKRELFNNWKMDVQNQITNISKTLDTSLQQFPHPDVGDRLDESSRDWQADEMTKRNRMQIGISQGLSSTAN